MPASASALAQIDPHAGDEQDVPAGLGGGLAVVAPVALAQTRVAPERRRERQVQQVPHALGPVQRGSAAGRRSGGVLVVPSPSHRWTSMGAGRPIDSIWNA